MVRWSTFEKKRDLSRRSLSRSHLWRRWVRAGSPWRRRCVRPAGPGTGSSSSPRWSSGRWGRWRWRTARGRAVSGGPCRWSGLGAAGRRRRGTAAAWSRWCWSCGPWWRNQPGPRPTCWTSAEGSGPPLWKTSLWGKYNLTYNMRNVQEQ